MKAKIKEIKHRFDASEHGGAPLLGITKPVIKAHGASNEKSIMNVTDMILNLATNKDAFAGR